MQQSHTRPVAAARFDDPNLMSTAGLAPVMALAKASGLLNLADRHLSVPTDKGANADRKIASLVGYVVGGADSIADLAMLRHGAMGTVFDRPYAPSTLGSFLRQFTFGHVRQLDAVASRFLSALAQRSPRVAGIGTGRVLVDSDDSIIEVHGHGKQGFGYGYSGVRGLNALLTTVITDTCAPVIVGQPPRTARNQRPSPHRSAGTWDSAFYGHPTLRAAIRAGADVSITVRLTATIRRAIESIDDDAWIPSEYTDALHDEATDLDLAGGGRRDPVHRARLQSPPDPRAAGRAPCPRPATEEGQRPRHVVRYLAVPRLLHHHRPRRPRHHRRRQTSPPPRHHRAGARGPEELRPHAFALGPVHRERRLAGLRGDGVQPHPRRRHPHR
jgi:hypothetical protein